MATLPAAAHVVAWLALGGTALYVAGQNRDLASRLERMEAAPAEGPAASATGSAPAALAGSKEFTTLRTKADDATRRADVLSVELTKLRNDHERLLATVLAMPEGAKAEAATATFVERPGFEDAVRSVVDRYALEHKFRDTLKKATGPIVPKKPPYAELAKALKLDGPQTARFEQDIRSIQTELFEILQIPRDDGFMPLEEIQAAEQYPEGSPKKTEAFLKLFKATIPGTQETYLERAVALVSRVKDGTKAYLQDEQRGLLDTIDLDWFGIQMP